MYKKLLIGVLFTFIISFFSCYCLANDMVDDVRNTIGGAQNAVEGAAKDMTNTAKDATGTMENKANDIGNSASNTMNSAASTMNNYDNNDDYTAVRTNGEGNAVLMGMTASAWTWLIIGIATVAIVALVWYYSTSTNKNYDHND